MIAEGKLPSLGRISVFRDGGTIGLSFENCQFPQLYIDGRIGSKSREVWDNIKFPSEGNKIIGESLKPILSLLQEELEKSQDENRTRLLKDSIEYITKQI